MIVWHNGRFLDRSACAIPPDDRGLTLGDGVFDTLLAEDGAPQDAQAHAARLARHAATVKIPLPPDFNLDETARRLLRENALAQGRAAIRTTLTRGPAARGLAPPDNPHPTILMTASPAPPPPGPATVIIASSVRRNDRSPLSRIKSLNYGDNMLAMMEAKQAGADEAIMLNTAGNACCAAAANIAIREGGSWITPPQAEGAMDGITRAALIAARAAREEPLPPARLMNADDIVLTSSLGGIRPVRAILPME